MRERRLRLNAFSMNCVSHIQHGLWRRKDTRQREFNSFDPWIELAQILEHGCFDMLFLADVVGVYDIYRGDEGSAVTNGIQIPANDPLPLISAMGHVTTNLGFVFTSSVLQAHPFTFARQISTLDHLTQGRIGWNIVTSYLPNAGQNLGFGGLPSHGERYTRAEEYLDVTYKLWEGSWDDDAVCVDLKNGVYANRDNVHRINHSGKYYQVAGPHLSEPSPQRTPLLFQAGSSDRGREFAARHAEGTFILTSLKSLNATRKAIIDIRDRAVRQGRERHDILIFQGVTPVVGGTEAEALARKEEYLQHISIIGGLVHMSGSSGVDLGSVDLDIPLKEVKVEAMKGTIESLIASNPNKKWTLRDLAKSTSSGNFLAGTPEQIASIFQKWFDAGIDGLNIVYAVTPGTFSEFIDGVIPELRKRGLSQSEYQVGTLREKLFGMPRLSDRHPAANYRGAFK